MWVFASSFSISLFSLSIFFLYLLSFLLSWLIFPSIFMVTMMSKSSGKAGDGESSSSSGKNGGKIGGGGISSSIFGNNTNNHACAVCRHQRRKCQANCALAPYFPAEKTEEFLNVLRHFGVSNVMKIFNSVDPQLRLDTMESIQYEANARRSDPVNGCLGIIRNLMKQIDEHRRELTIINEQLYFHRQREQQMMEQEPPQMYGMFEPSPPMPLPAYSGVYHPPPPAPVYPAVDDAYNIGQMKNLNLGNSNDRVPEEYQDIKPFNRMPQDVIRHNAAMEAAEEASAESIIKIPQCFDHLMGPKMENMGRGAILIGMNHGKGKQPSNN